MNQQPVYVVLAGGVGKRFYPLTTDKTLVPVLGKPLIQHTLEMLERVGAQEVVVVTNPQNQDWIAAYQSKFKLDTVLLPEALGMAAALLKVEEFVQKRSMIVMNAIDLVEDQLLVDLIEMTTNNQPVVTGIKVSEYFPGGYLQLDGDRVVSVVEKPDPGQEPSDLVNLVFHFFPEADSFMSLLKTTKSEADDVYEVALATVMEREPVHFLAYQGYWQAVKYSHMLLDVCSLLLSKKVSSFIHESAQVSDKAVVSGQVYIDEGAKIFEGAVVKGPAYIGKNVVIGNHTLIRESTIEARSVVGFGSEITRSYIGPDCFLHHNFVGDTILEKAINPSWGTVFTNWRIDKKPVSVKLPKRESLATTKDKLGAIVGADVFCGTGCSIMPGVTIGRGAKIFPQSVVFQAIEPEQVIKP